MVQEELKSMLRNIVKEIENEHILSVDELIQQLTLEIQNRILVLENM